MTRTIQPRRNGDDSDFAADEDFPEPPRLRLLRRLVTALMVVMGLGMVLIAGTVVWRLGVSPPAPPAPLPVSAAEVVLPEGFAVQALGGDGPHVLVLGRDAEGAERLLTLDRASGEILSDAPVTRR